MDILVLKKTLTEKLGKDPSCTSITFNKLNINIYSLMKAIDIVMSIAIPKARLFPKSVPRFDKRCKKIQIDAKRLEKIWKK